VSPSTSVRAVSLSNGKVEPRPEADPMVSRTTGELCSRFVRHNRPMPAGVFWQADESEAEFNEDCPHAGGFAALFMSRLFEAAPA
jgi:hypothetical protein